MVTMAETTALSINRRIPDAAAIGTLLAADGWPLRVFDWPATAPAKGSILFQTGRGDFFEKYLETFEHWHNAGWGVSAFDWRGQSGSGRLTPNAHVGHIDDFKVWVDDLAAFWADWTQATPGPHVIMGHSMGGHIVLRALVEKRIAPDAYVLVAPMLGFNTPAFMAPVVEKMAAWCKPTTAAWPENEKPTLPYSSRQKLLTFDDARYADELWWREQKPELVMGPPSWQWLAAANRSIDALLVPGGLEALNCPSLILATTGDKLVSPSEIQHCAARIKDVELVRFDKTVGHEILRERDGPRGYALQKIDALLALVSNAL
jgi:lysophospholipase